MHYESSDQSCVCVCMYVWCIFSFLAGRVIVYTVLDRGCMNELVGRYLSMFVLDHGSSVCVVDRLYAYYLTITIQWVGYICKKSSING